MAPSLALCIASPQTSTDKLNWSAARSAARPSVHEIRELIDYDAFCGTSTPEPEAVTTSGEITPRELAERMARGDKPRIIDVREPQEFAIARIPGAELIPLGTLGAAQTKLDPNAEIVIHCHSGVRSLFAARHLRDAGFKRVLNLTGGINRWSDEVDPTVPKY